MTQISWVLKTAVSLTHHHRRRPPLTIFQLPDSAKIRTSYLNDAIEPARQILPPTLTPARVVVGAYQ